MNKLMQKKKKNKLFKFFFFIGKYLPPHWPILPFKNLEDQSRLLQNFN